MRNSPNPTNHPHLGRSCRSLRQDPRFDHYRCSVPARRCPLPGPSLSVSWPVAHRLGEPLSDRGALGPSLARPILPLPGPARDLGRGGIYPAEVMPDLPPGVTRDYPLARLTTIRTGGPAELFAR